MGADSKIEWTDASWNPVVGCSVVSPGCTNCYAMGQAARIVRCANGAPSHYDGTTQPSKAGPVWTGKVALAPDHIITAPLRWRRPRRIFVNSMGDLFHESAPDEWIDRVFAVMALAPRHTFQVLTKRAKRMRDYLGTRSGDWQVVWPDANPPGSLKISRHEQRQIMGGAPWATLQPPSFPLSNVWLGVSAEDQTRANERIPDLLETPAAVRFVSAEPLLGPIHLRKVFDHANEHSLDALIGRRYYAAHDEEGEAIAHLDWIIVGGESGPGARPMHPDWARAIRDECAAAGVPFFFKQWGEWLPEDDMPDAAKTYVADLAAGRTYRFTGIPLRRIGKHRAGRLLDRREHNDMPESRA